MDIRDRKRESLKEKAKAGLRKKSAKNKTKNDKLLEVAATIPKITNFFTRKQKPPNTTPSSSNPLVVPMEWDCLDGMAEDMEWDEYPALPWSVVHQMEETRHRACRKERAAFHRKLTLKNLEMKKLEKESLKQFMRDLIMDRWEGEKCRICHQNFVRCKSLTFIRTRYRDHVWKIRGFVGDQRPHHYMVYDSVCGVQPGDTEYQQDHPQGGDG